MKSFLKFLLKVILYLLMFLIGAAIFPFFWPLGLLIVGGAVTWASEAF